MSEAGKREARVFTVACLIVAGSGVASSVSPTIEDVLNRWVGVPLVVGAVAVVLWALGRRAWWSVLARREERRRLHPDEMPRADEERA